MIDFLIFFVRLSLSGYLIAASKADRAEPVG